MKSAGNCCNCNQLHNNSSWSQRFSTVLWTQSTLEELVQIDFVALAVKFLWPHSQFSGSKRKSSWNYRAQRGIVPLHKILQNVASALFPVFLREFITVIRNITCISCA